MLDETEPGKAGGAWRTGAGARLPKRARRFAMVVCQKSRQVIGLTGQAWNRQGGLLDPFRVHWGIAHVDIQPAQL
jgi:hypothetical protein